MGGHRLNVPHRPLREQYGVAGSNHSNPYMKAMLASRVRQIEAFGHCLSSSIMGGVGRLIGRPMRDWNRSSMDSFTSER